MAWSYTVKSTNGHMGAIRKVYGTYANDSGSTGGEVDTGLLNVEMVTITPDSTGELVPGVALNSASQGAFTLTTNADESGVWSAEGEG